MVNGIIGKKIGMTQLFLEDGTVEPATVLQAGPCVVVQAKTAERDGYESVQLGLVSAKKYKANKATAGHHKASNVPPTRVRREVKRVNGAEAPKPGDSIVVGAVFNQGERVDVIGTSKGHGFQGVMKRHHFGGGAGHPRLDVPPRARARSAPRPTRRGWSRACGWPATWARTA